MINSNSFKNFLFILNFLLFSIFYKNLSAKTIQKNKIKSNQNIQYNFYYIVKKGDTLYHIAKKFHISIKKLKKLNNLKSNLIKPGQRLKIGGIQKKTELTLAESKKNLINLPYFYYVVKRGDNLYKIAKKFDTSVRLLKKLNHLRSGLIKPGQKIKIPEIYVIKPTLINIPGLINHKVKRGETLYTISLKYNVPIETIKKINHLNDNFIFVGQILKIPKNSKEAFILKNPALTYQQKIEDKTLSKKFHNLFLSKSVLGKEEEQLLRDKFLEISKQYRRYRYKYGGNGNNGYLDCSMFVKLVYEELGISLPRTSREQFRIGIKVNKNELIPGDLVFFSKYRRKKYVSHVGIYIGNNKFVHFCSAKRGLAIDSLNSHYFRTHFVGAKRILNLNLFKHICKLSKNTES